MAPVGVHGSCFIWVHHAQAYPGSLFTFYAEAALDMAATVLRLLYLRDLRMLQTQIDEALVRVQASYNLFASPLLAACAATGKSGCRALEL